MTNIRLISPFSRWIYPQALADMDFPMPSFGSGEGIDIVEEEGKIVVKAPVPGIPASDVDIEFENGVLRIKAEHIENEKQKDAKKIVYKEQRVRSFEYTTTLPRPVDPKSLEAVVVDGVVQVSAQIADEAKPKKIPVKAA